MGEQIKRNHPTSKSCFLDRFSGKLNVITKEGQIKDESSIKLPIIDSPESRKSNTMKSKISKSSSLSFFSHSRSATSNSSIIRHRAEKYLTQNYDRESVDLSKGFMKKSEFKQLKKLTKNQVVM